jgi:hypothetical protein
MIASVVGRKIDPICCEPGEKLASEIGIVVTVINA